MSMEERKDKRIHVRVPITFEGKQGVGEGTLFNLSKGGCAIASNVPVQLCAHITLRLHIPTQKQPIEVTEAGVTWTSGQDFGVQFLNLAPQEKDRLQQAIAELQEQTPDSNQGPAQA